MKTWFVLLSTIIFFMSIGDVSAFQLGPTYRSVLFNRTGLPEGLDGCLGMSRITLIGTAQIPGVPVDTATDFDAGISESSLIVGPLQAQLNHQNYEAWAQLHAQSHINSQLGQDVWGGNHSFGSLHVARTQIFHPAWIARARLENWLRFDTQYRSWRKDEYEEMDNDTYTLRKRLYFLVHGASVGSYLAPTRFPEEPGEEFGRFFHYVRVAESEMSLVHLGEGIFWMFGQLQTSSEKSPDSPSTNYDAIFLGGVNNLYRANQVMRFPELGSEGPGGDPITVTMRQLQESGAAAGGPMLDIGNPAPTFNQYLIGFTNNGDFDGIDLSFDR